MIVPGAGLPTKRALIPISPFVVPRFTGGPEHAKAEANVANRATRSRCTAEQWHSCDSASHEIGCNREMPWWKSASLRAGPGPRQLGDPGLLWCGDSER